MKKILSLLTALTLIISCLSGLCLTACAEDSTPTGTIQLTNIKSDWVVNTTTPIAAGSLIYDYISNHEKTTSKMVYTQSALELCSELVGATVIETCRTDTTGLYDNCTTDFANININNSAYIYVLCNYEATDVYMNWLISDGYELINSGDTRLWLHTDNYNSSKAQYLYCVYRKTVNLKDGETADIVFKSQGLRKDAAADGSNNPYTVAVKWIANYKDSDLLTYHEDVYDVYEPFALDNQTTYEGPAGVVFGKAIDKYSGLARIEYGVAISKENISVDEFKTNENVEFAAGSKITDNYQFGIRFYGSEIKAGNTYYTLPYAKYKDGAGKEITVFGDKVLDFTPKAQ